MFVRCSWFVFIFSVIGISSVSGGSIYKVTSGDGDKAITYNVSFGGGFKFEQVTAFDPVTKKFVYLKWDRNVARPDPAMTIWDHRTGETIPLYRFPDAKNPLPLIPSIEAMKVCPITGDKNFKAKLSILFD